MGAYASIATPLHVIYDLRDSLPAGSLMILAPLVLSLIMNRRRSSQESSRPPSPMASCTFVTPFRYDVRRSRSRTEEHAPTGQPGSPPSLEPGWRRPSMSEPEPEFPFLVDCPPAENTAPLTPSHEEEFDDTRKTQRCPLNKFDRFRPKRNKEELAYARSSENHRPSDRRMEKLPHSAPARERLASCGGGEDSALPSADAGGNGIAGRRQLCGVSASQESIEIARRLYDDDDCGLASDLSWNSFDVSEDSQQSGRPDSVLWETRKSHFPKLMSAVLSEPHADDESDARGDCGLVPGERCMSVDEEPELGTTTEIFGDRRFDELLQLCGQEKAATFSDLLQELGVQKCLKLREAEGEEVFCVDAGRGGGTALLTVLHGDIAIRRGKHTLQDDIRARAGSSPETFTNGTSKESGSGDFLEYYCVRDKYSEVLVKACINYFNLKGCTTFGDDQRRMIRPYIVVVKPIPDVASSYL